MSDKRGPKIGDAASLYVVMLVALWWLQGAKRLLRETHSL